MESYQIEDITHLAKTLRAASALVGRDNMAAISVFTRALSYLRLIEMSLDQTEKPQFLKAVAVFQVVLLNINCINQKRGAKFAEFAAQRASQIQKSIEEALQTQIPPLIDIERSYQARQSSFSGSNSRPSTHASFESRFATPKASALSPSYQSRLNLNAPDRLSSSSVGSAGSPSVTRSGLLAHRDNISDAFAAVPESGASVAAASSAPSLRPSMLAALHPVLRESQRFLFTDEEVARAAAVQPAGIDAISELPESPIVTRPRREALVPPSPSPTSAPASPATRPRRTALVPPSPTEAPSAPESPEAVTRPRRAVVALAPAHEHLQAHAADSAAAAAAVASVADTTAPGHCSGYLQIHSAEGSLSDSDSDAEPAGGEGLGRWARRRRCFLVLKAGLLACFDRAVGPGAAAADPASARGEPIDLRAYVLRDHGADPEVITLHEDAALSAQETNEEKQRATHVLQLRSPCPRERAKWSAALALHTAYARRAATAALRQQNTALEHKQVQMRGQLEYLRSQVQAQRALTAGA